jgi:hypothetical protein
MLKLPLALVAVLGVALTLATRTVAQTVPSGLPLAIMCWNQASKHWIVGYLATVKVDGTATYRAGQLSGTVNAKTHVVEAPDNRPAVLDCFGKTLDQLRSSGRLIELQRAR